MTRTRLELHEELCEVLGSRNCYFSPPSNMKYPCIKYEEGIPSKDYADNIVYRYKKCWILTIIDTDPDSGIRERLEKHFKMYLSFDRPYTADNLNHWVYTLYY